MINIPVGVSNRHVHLNREDLNILFGNNYELTLKRKLSQGKDYACEETVILETSFGRIENVRLIGPTRTYTQVEILKSDCDILKLNPPYRNSGELNDSENITIIGPKGKIYKENCCIIANRHIHINNVDYKELTEGSKVKLYLSNGNVIDEVYIKRNEGFKLELHIDKDDGKEFALDNGDIVIYRGDI